MLGYQDLQSLSFITEELTVNYHLSVMKPTQQNQLTRIFRKTSSSIKKLLVDMLQYNPYFRPNIEECLESEVFNSIRVNKIEKVQTSEIELDILNPHTFDYKTGVSLTYSID